MKKHEKAEALKASLSALVLTSAQKEKAPGEPSSGESLSLSEPSDAAPISPTAASEPRQAGNKSDEGTAILASDASNDGRTEMSGGQFLRIGLSLFGRDIDLITAIMTEALKRGQRLNQSQAVRLALRAVNPTKLNTKDIIAVRMDDRRRKAQS